MEEVYRNILSLLQRRLFKESERLCLFELGKLDKPDAQLLFYLGTSARMLLKNDAALVAFEAALDIEPNNVDFLQAAASTYEALKDYQKSYEIMARVVKLEPDNVAALANYGVALERLNRLQAAADIYDEVLQKDANQIIANINYGTVLHKLNRKRLALTQNRLAYARLPQHFATLYNLVDTLIANFQFDEALELSEKGLSVQPRHAHLMMKKAIALSGLSRCEDALMACSQARIINPNVVYDLLPWTRSLSKITDVYMDGHVIEYEARYAEQMGCYWKNRDKYIEKLKRDIDRNLHQNRSLAGPENAFKILSLDISADRRLELVRNMAIAIEENAWETSEGPFKYKSTSRKKIRIGYLSPDFRFHPMSVLIRQFFEMHDRSQFEIFSYSLFNEKQTDLYRQAVQTKSDVFHDVSTMKAWEIANLINKDGIDLLIDLAGYTAHSRSEVMAMRPAPMQMQYIGFMQTMGADFIDYVLVDKHHCPDGKFDEWQEEPIRLPHSLWPYDNEIDHSPTTLKRCDFDLSEDTFVFCCFTNSYKIEPGIFDRWMNILKAVPGSLLWLFGQGLDIQDNLEREAEARGVDKSRLVFTGRVPLEQHLPRYQLADLFLDTYWHNAHTTGAETLWQGLPLITIMGEVSSARGAASILTALEMPELIVQNHDEYEQLAIYYATHPVEYAAMREKLKAKRYTSPMYNTKLTVKHIESAYKLAWERYQAGLPPEAFDVPEIMDPELRKSIH